MKKSFIKAFKNVFALSAMVVGTLICKQSVQASELQINENEIYEIRSALDTNYVLDIAGPSTSNYATAQLWSDVDVENQRFRFAKDAEGYYVITSVYSGKVLDTDGSDIYQKGYHGGDSQKWFIADAGNQRFYMINKKTGLYADVDNAYAACGSNVKMFQRNDYYDAQKWMFTLPNGQSVVSQVEVLGDVDKVKAAYPVGTKWDDNSSYQSTYACFGFARKAFKIMYGCDMSSAYSGAKKYNYGKLKNVELVARLAETSNDVSTEDIKNLLMQARQGDILQVARYQTTNAKSTTPHSMIVEYVNENGITVYHGNWKDKVAETTFTWEQYKANFFNNPKNKSGVGTSIYRYSN